jgi:hypothetical protein
LNALTLTVTLPMVISLTNGSFAFQVLQDERNRPAQLWQRLPGLPRLDPDRLDSGLNRIANTSSASPIHATKLALSADRPHLHHHAAGRNDYSGPAHPTRRP